MLTWLPPGVELIADVSPADWVARGLKPMGLAPSGAFLESFAPHRFEAYARIFHAARFRSARRGAIDPGRGRRWADLPRERGVRLTPDVAFIGVAGIEPDDDHALDEIAPMDGTLGPGDLRRARGAPWTPHLNIRGRVVLPVGGPRRALVKLPRPHRGQRR